MIRLVEFAGSVSACEGKLESPARVERPMEPVQFPGFHFHDGAGLIGQNLTAPIAHSGDGPTLIRLPTFLGPPARGVDRPTSRTASPHGTTATPRLFRCPIYFSARRHADSKTGNANLTRPAGRLRRS